MNSTKWLQMATYKTKNASISSEELKLVLSVVHGSYSSDSMRMHIVSGIEKCECVFCQWGKTPEFDLYVPKNWNVAVGGDTKALLSIIKEIDKSVISIEGLSDTKLDVEGTEFDVICQYPKVEKHVSILLQKKYLMEALRGMGKRFILKFLTVNGAVVIESEDGKRKAVIMPFAQ